MRLSLFPARLLLTMSIVALAYASDEGVAVAPDWPCWRGPSGNNHSADPNPPLVWNVATNIEWKVAVHGRGHASPCIVGDRIFLASADEQSGTQFILCFDRRDGTLRWRKDCHHGVLPSIHTNNSHASATPACNGNAIFIVFSSDDQLYVAAVSVDGELRWKKQIGKFQHANGYGSSTVLFDNLLIIANDNQADPCLVALQQSDGQIAWRMPRSKSDNSATPLVAKVAGRPQLLLNGTNALVSYDPTTGVEIWRATHNTEIAANTIVCDSECVYASGNVPEKLLMCVRADGQGDVTESHVLWRKNRSNPYVPSPLVDNELLFTLLDAGMMVCREARTGRELWKRRLEGTFFASPVLAAGRIYALNDVGTTYVLRAAPTFELLATNELNEPCMATPAICGGHVYIRTAEHLYCIGPTNDR
jgi:outer membrane protein assembly factor BamB